MGQRFDYADGSSTRIEYRVQSKRAAIPSIFVDLSGLRDPWLIKDDHGKGCANQERIRIKRQAFRSGIL